MQVFCLVLTIIKNYHTWNKQVANLDWHMSCEGRVARPIPEGLQGGIALGIRSNHTKFLITECRWRHCLVMVCILTLHKTWLSSRLLGPSREHLAYSNRILEESLIKSLFTEMWAGLQKPKRDVEASWQQQKAITTPGLKGAKLGNCSYRGGMLKRSCGFLYRSIATDITL